MQPDKYLDCKCVPLYFTAKSLAEDDDKGRDDEMSWWELVYDFTQNTTLHGIRYITLTSKFFIRRLVICDTT